MIWIQQRSTWRPAEVWFVSMVEGSLSARFDDDGTFTPTGKYALCY